MITLSKSEARLIIEVLNVGMPSDQKKRDKLARLSNDLEYLVARR